MGKCKIALNFLYMILIIGFIKKYIHNINKINRYKGGRTMKNLQIAVYLLIILFAITAIVYAADDPGIKGELREGIGSAMNEHIKQNTVDNRYVIYDAVAGELKRLKFDKLHKGIVKKGDLYVSCADFIDTEGNKYDIDFLVGNTGKGQTTLESVVHSINGKKRAYHVED
jgi:hypothetical protein